MVAGRGCGELARLGELALGLPQQRRQSARRYRVAERIAALAGQQPAARARAARAPSLTGRVQQRIGCRRRIAQDICAARRNAAPCVAAACASSSAAARQGAGLELALVGVDRSRRAYLRTGRARASRRAHAHRRRDCRSPHRPASASASRHHCRRMSPTPARSRCAGCGRSRRGTPPAPAGLRARRAAPAARPDSGRSRARAPPRRTASTAASAATSSDAHRLRHSAADVSIDGDEAGAEVAPFGQQHIIRARGSAGAHRLEPDAGLGEQLAHRLGRHAVLGAGAEQHEGGRASARRGTPRSARASGRRGRRRPSRRCRSAR